MCCPAGGIHEEAGMCDVPETRSVVAQNGCLLRPCNIQGHLLELESDKFGRDSAFREHIASKVQQRVVHRYSFATPLTGEGSGMGNVDFQ